MLKLLGLLCFGGMVFVIIWPLFVPIFLIAYWLSGIKNDLDKIPDRYRK